jgi:hypothetical protein
MSNYKFWEELIAYIYIIVIWVSDATWRKKTLVCMRNEVNKQYNLGVGSVGATEMSGLYSTSLRWPQMI